MRNSPQQDSWKYSLGEDVLDVGRRADGVSNITTAASAPFCSENGGWGQLGGNGGDCFSSSCEKVGVTEDGKLTIRIFEVRCNVYLPSGMSIAQTSCG